MRNEFMAIIEWDKEWYIAVCPEIPPYRPLRYNFGSGSRVFSPPSWISR